MTGHDRPLFGSNDMGDTGDIPQDDVVIAYGPVPGGPFPETVIDLVAGGIFPGGIFLAFLVLGDPKLVIEEPGLLSDDRALGHKRRRLRARPQHIADVLAQRVVLGIADDLPAARGFSV